MRLFRLLFPALLGCALAISAAAQNQTQANPPSAQPRVATPLPSAPPEEPPIAGPPAQTREFVPEGVVALGQSAASRTEFTFDHQLLVLASKLDKSNEDLRKVIAGVSRVSVHSYRFPEGVSTDLATMASINEKFEGAGWLHLVSKHKNGKGETTDLWLRIDQASIRDVAVLFVKAREVDFISASGVVTPLDLLRLSGHFGIPKLDSGIKVPLPER